MQYRILQGLGLLGKRTEKTTSQGTINSRDFLSLPVSEIMFRLGTSPGGLTTDEALERLEIYGRNEIVSKSKGICYPKIPIPLTQSRYDHSYYSGHFIRNPGGCDGCSDHFCHCSRERI